MKRKKFEIIFWALVCIGIFLLNFFLKFQKPADYPAGICYARAKVTDVVWEEMGQDPDYGDIEIGKQLLKLVVIDGHFAGKEIEIYNYIERTMPHYAAIGTKVIVASYDGFITTMWVGYDRTVAILLFLGVFVLLILVLGKRKGVRSLFSLGFTILCIIFLLIPLMLYGMDPIWASVIVVVLSTMVTFIAVCGLNQKSLLASLTCMICCVIAGLYAYLFEKCVHISTLNTPEAESLLFISENTSLQIRNLLIGGILIASMGAIMDTSMSMVSSMCELKACNPQISKVQLMKSGFRIGSDIMGTMTNTLILAFAGGSINSVLIYFMYQSSPMVICNSDLFVIEMIRGLSGSIAVVCSIPVSIWLTTRYMDIRK